MHRTATVKLFWKAWWRENSWMKCLMQEGEVWAWLSFTGGWDALWSWLLLSGHAGRASTLSSLCCPVARLSSPAQVGHPSKLSRFCGETRDIGSVGGDSRSPHAAAAHRSLRALTRSPFPNPQKEPSQAGMLPFGQASCSRVPILKLFQETCAGGGGLLHSAEASRSGRVWSRAPLQELMKEFRLNQLLDHNAKKKKKKLQWSAHGGCFVRVLSFSEDEVKDSCSETPQMDAGASRCLENEEQISQFSTVKKWIMSVEHILTERHKSKTYWSPPLLPLHLSHSLQNLKCRFLLVCVMVCVLSLQPTEATNHWKPSAPPRPEKSGLICYFEA